MALVVNDRVKETSTTTGTGTFDLAGAVSGFESFVAGIGNSNTTYYSIVNENGEFEVGLGTVTDAATDTLSRDTIISSSNSDSAVNFGAGTKNVFCTLPASKAVILDSSGNIVANNGSNLTNLNASNVASGTLASDRLPTVPTTKGGTGLTAIGTANQVIAVNAGATALEYQTVDLANLNADNLTSGTVPDARFPATLPAASGVNLTALNASNVASGTLSSDRLPTVPTTKGGTGLTAIGTANQVLAVNSGATALEYQTISADITGVTAGDGLTGGGTTGDVTLNVGAGSGISVTADQVAHADTSTLSGTYGQTGNSGGTVTANINLTVDGFGHVTDVQSDNVDLDSRYTQGVTAGSGLTGGGASGSVTLNVGAGTGIDVAADTIAVDVSDFMTNGSNNRIVTATGTDAMNAEANMTFDGSTLTVTGDVVPGANVTSDHVLPNATDTYDLGASANVWRNVYTGDLHLSNEAKEEGNAIDGTKGNWTIQEGEEHLYILNNKSGKKFRFKLEEM